MSRLSRIVLALLLAFPALASSSLALAQGAESSKNDEDRLKQEAQALLQVVVAGLSSTPGICELDKEWYSRPVPHHLAKMHLGHTIHSDLMGLKTGATTAEILDPKGKHPEWFCGVEEFRQEFQRRKDKALAAVRAGQESDLSRSSMTQWDFSFPVFDRSFRTAIAVLSSTSSMWLMRDGQLQQSISLSVNALVYRKANGRWRLIEYEELVRAH